MSIAVELDLFLLCSLLSGMLPAPPMPELQRPARGDERTGDSATAETTPHFLEHRMRLRKRFLDAGAAALADYEMLELVLFRAIPRRDLKPLAKTLLARFGSFAEVISAPRERVKEVKGLGEAAIAELKIIEAAASRLARLQAGSLRVTENAITMDAGTGIPDRG